MKLTIEYLVLRVNLYNKYVIFFSDYFLGMWKKYDQDGNGELTRGEVMEIIKDYFPPEKKNEVIGQFLCYCDLDGSGKISKDEFMQFFC